MSRLQRWPGRPEVLIKHSSKYLLLAAAWVVVSSTLCNLCVRELPTPPRPRIIEFLFAEMPERTLRPSAILSRQLTISAHNRCRSRQGLCSLAHSELKRFKTVYVMCTKMILFCPKDVSKLTKGIFADTEKRHAGGIRTKLQAGDSR